MNEDVDKCYLGAPEAKVIQINKANVKDPLLICGFPSSGLVGTIAANHIIEQFEMKQIAFVRSIHIPSATVFLGGRLNHPFRVHADESRNILVITAAVPVAEAGMYAVSSSIMDWAKEMGVKEVVVLDGIPVSGIPSDRKVLYVAEEEKMPDLSADTEMEMLEKGIIRGIAGSVLAETLSHELTGFALLTPAITVMPDPKGASMVLRALDRLYNLGIDVNELEDQAEKIRKRLQEMAEQVEGIRKQQAESDGKEFQRLYA